MTNSIDLRPADTRQVPAETTLRATLAPERPANVIAEPTGDIALSVEDLNLWYGSKQALTNVSMKIPVKQVTALIGPSGCGKSTLLRSINRMNDLIPNVTTKGRIRYHGVDLYGPGIDPVEVRRRIGMVFQKPNPFPKSIYDNVVFGAKVNGYKGNFQQLA